MQLRSFGYNPQPRVETLILFGRLGNTSEVLSRVGITLAFVVGYGGIRAERTCQSGTGNADLRVTSNRTVGNDPLRSNSLRHPAIERQNSVMVGVVWDAGPSGNVAVRKVRGTLATAAVLHPRDHEEPVKGLDRGSAIGARVGIVAKKGTHLLVVVDRIPGSDGRILPAVVLNQLAAVSPETAQVRVPGVEDRRRLLVG